MILRLALPLVVFALLGALLFAGLGRDPDLVPSPLIDKPVPAFDVPQLMDPAKRFTDADLRGQVSLLNVWASWCPGCRVEHDIVAGLAKNSEVRVFGLNWKDDRRDALRWLSQFGNPYAAIAFDPDNDMGIDFGVYGAPETFLIDADGRIRYKHVGILTPEIVERELMPRIERLKGEAS